MMIRCGVVDIRYIQPVHIQRQATVHMAMFGGLAYTCINVHSGSAYLDMFSHNPGSVYFYRETGLHF